MQEGKIPSFFPTDDPFKSLNKSIAFLSSAITSRYTQTNNQHRTPSNPRNQATIQEGKVDMGKALDVSLVVIESSGTESAKQDTSSRSKNDTDALDADIRLVSDEEPRAEDAKQCQDKELSKPVTPYYLPNESGSIFAKPYHVVASSNSRNSSKNMPRFSLNDIVHNHYLEEARKKTQERNRNSKPSVLHTTSLQNTTIGSKPKPSNNNQTSRSLHVSKSCCVTSNGVPLVDHSRNSSSFSDSKDFVCSTSQKCVFNANHDDCITKFLKDMNSRAKSSTVHEKTNTPRSYLRWKLTGRVFKTAGLRWIPTRKLLASSTTKVDSKPPHGSDVDISNPHECIQALDIIACTLNLDTDTSYNVKKDNLRPPSSVVSYVLPATAPLPADTTGTPSLTTIDQDAPSASTSPITHEIQAPVIHQDPNPKESSSRDVIPSNSHQLNQSFDNLIKWTKDHSLDNVIGNPSRPVLSRSQLQTNAIRRLSTSGHIPETLKRLAKEEEE
ncbi:hypothetical protein Tco_1036451 [Tanacetum coccineum]